MDRRLLHRLTHPITYVRVTELDKYGKPKDPEEIPLLAYRHGTRKRVIDFNGTDFISQRQYIVDGMYDAEEGDIIKIGSIEKPLKAVSVFDGLIPGTGTTVFYV